MTNIPDNADIVRFVHDCSKVICPCLLVGQITSLIHGYSQFLLLIINPYILFANKE